MEMLNFGSKRFLFDNLGGWSEYTKNAVRTLLNGVLGVLASIFVGIATMLYKLGVFLAKLIRMRPLLSVAVVATILTIFWVMVSVRLKVKSKTFEHQRDSLAYELMKYKQAYTPTDSFVIIRDSAYIYCNEATAGMYNIIK